MRNFALVAMIGFALGTVVTVLTHSLWHHVTNNGLSNHQGSGTVSLTAPSDSESNNDVPESVKSELRHSSPLVEQTAKIEPVEPTADEVIERPVDAPNAFPVDQLGREIPAEFVAMVTPRPLPEKLTTQEMYQEFLSDSRDEAWAYPMELGINQYIEERGGAFGATFEYVQCTSRFCTIAGIVYDGGQPTVNEFMAEMTQRGWWQTFGGRNTVGSKTNNEYRFVSIFPRTPEDFSRRYSSGQSSAKGGEASVKSVDG